MLIWGLREWRVEKALQAYKRGEGSLAHAARQAGISLREMIPLAYAHGLVPKIDPVHLEIVRVASRPPVKVVSDAVPLMALAKVDGLVRFFACFPAPAPACGL